jgi:3-methyladenine DNA glycosylase AlkC
MNQVGDYPAFLHRSADLSLLGTTLMAKRIGSARRAAIPAKVLQGLNNGTLESATLAEGLAVDFHALLKVVAPDLPTTLLSRIQQTDGITLRMKAVGEALHERYGINGWSRFASHGSDTVRSWAAYLVSAVPGLSLIERLKFLRPLADDAHFGVREWAWCAARGAIAAEIVTAIQLLAAWTKNESPNIRRFASESTRPQGVWCPHIALLKSEPKHGLPILEPLKSDPSKYVRDSVANWLNDAGKSKPGWVRNLCRRWDKERPTAETRYIVSRATRNL